MTQIQKTQHDIQVLNQTPTPKVCVNIDKRHVDDGGFLWGEVIQWDPTRYNIPDGTSPPSCTRPTSRTQDFLEHSPRVYRQEHIQAVIRYCTEGAAIQARITIGRSRSLLITWGKYSCRRSARSQRGPSEQSGSQLGKGQHHGRRERSVAFKIPHPTLYIYFPSRPFDYRSPGLIVHLSSWNAERHRPWRKNSPYLLQYSSVHRHFLICFRTCAVLRIHSKGTQNAPVDTLCTGPGRY